LSKKFWRVAGELDVCLFTLIMLRRVNYMNGLDGNPTLGQKILSKPCIISRYLPDSDQFCCNMTRKTQHIANEYPFVSVIMPIRNEEDFIARSLGAVLAQDYPQDKIEVLVVDGMSTDKTRQIVQRISRENPHVFLLDNPQKIAPYALNRGLAAAKGEIIVRVDGHCEIAPDYVRRCVQYLENEEIGGVGGPLETIGANDMAQTIAIAMSSPFGVGGSAFRTVQDKTLFVDTVAFPAYRRQHIRSGWPL
jgi:succinoglycan biosynthesis protein ExoA